MPPARLRRGGLSALVAALLALTFAGLPARAEDCLSIDQAQAAMAGRGYRHIATLTGAPLLSAVRMYRAVAPGDETAFDFALVFDDPAEGGGALLLGRNICVGPRAAWPKRLWPSVARQVLGEPA
jgi:hypothetical protein